MDLLYAYIDAHRQRLIDEFPRDVVQDISRFKPQRANMTFSDQSRYNIMFQQVLHKGGESEINYIKIFHNDKALDISVRNSYTEYQLMHAFLDNLKQSGNCSAHIVIHQTC